MGAHEDEIDLRPYAITILRHWWLILSLVILFAGAGYLISVRQPKKYQATATVIVIRSRTSLVLAEQYRLATDPIDARSKVQALMSIAESDAVTAQALASLNGRLKNGATPLDSVKQDVTITNTGDAILFSASHSNPELAAEIANAWAENATQAINLAYGQGQTNTDIQTELSDALDSYSVAQNELEQFVGDNRIELLTNQITEARTLLTSLASERAWNIEYYSQRARSMEQIIDQAEALKGQLQSGNHSAAGQVGDALAVLFTRANVLSIRLIPVEITRAEIPIVENNDPEDESSQPAPQPAPQQAAPVSQPGFSYTLQVEDFAQLQDTPEKYSADLEQLIQQAKSEQAAASDKLKGLSEEISGAVPLGEVEKTAAQLSSLEARLEKEQARKKELTTGRDVAWDAYTALLEKATESRRSSPVSKEASLASRATVPTAPMSSNAARNALFGALVGLALGVFLVLAGEWLRSIREGQAVPAPLSESS